jgi:acetamidase/formamidase
MRREYSYGRFGGGLEPVVRVERGESVAYGTPNAMWDREDPDPARGEVSRISRPDGADHALAGPVWVERAQPGDVLVVRVRE